MFYFTHSVLNLIVCLIWSFGSKKLSGDGAKSVMSNVMRGVGCRRTKCFVRKLFEIKSHWPNEWLITCSHPHPKCWLLLENVLCQKTFPDKKSLTRFWPSDCSHPHPKCWLLLDKVLCLKTLPHFFLLFRPLPLGHWHLMQPRSFLLLSFWASNLHE